MIQDFRKTKEKKRRAIIIGAGVSGFAAAQYLKQTHFDVYVIEKSDHIGGLCQTFKAKNFNYDFGPHIIFSRTKQQQDWWDLWSDGINYKDYIVRLSIDGSLEKESLFDFPVSKQNLRRIIDNKKDFQFYLNRLGDHNFDKMLSVTSSDDASNFEDYMKSRIGENAYDKFVRGYNLKQWGCDPKELHVNWASNRPFKIKEVSPPKMFGDLNAGYPVNTYRSIFDKLSDGIKIDFNMDVIKVELSKKSDYIRRLFVKYKSEALGDDALTAIDIDPDDIIINTGALDDMFNTDLKWTHILKLYYLAKTQNIPTYSTTFPNTFRFTRMIDYNKIFNKNYYTNIDQESLISFAFPVHYDTDQFKNITQPPLDYIIETSEFLVKNKIDFMYSHHVFKDKVYPKPTFENEKKFNEILRSISKIKNFYTTGRAGLFSYISMSCAVEYALKTCAIIDDFYIDRLEFYKKLRSDVW